MKQIFVTGGAGFIGSNFIRYVMRQHPDVRVVNFDALTYAGNAQNLSEIDADSRYRFIHGNNTDRAAVLEAMRGCDTVVNFAAESHVDRSIADAASFIDTNVHGVYNVLCAARDLEVERVLHMSTDEVYGPSTARDPRREDHAFAPHSPYAASKAAGDLMCSAFAETYGMGVVVARPANNIGPNQHVEKAVPLFITNALEGEPLPVYGEGAQIRDRMYVDDCVGALLLLLERGEAGEAYNIQAGNQRPNLEVAQAVLDLLDRPRDLLRFVEDREGHDECYFLDTQKISALGWAPQHSFDDALERTVRWYRDHRDWWSTVRDADFRAYYERQYGERLAGARPYAG